MEQNVETKVLGALKGLEKRRINDEKFVKEVEKAEEFPIPTFINPKAVFTNATKATEELVKRNISKIEKKECLDGGYVFNEKQKKLMELRARILAARKDNELSVLDEHKQAVQKIRKKIQAEEDAKTSKRLKRIGVSSKHTHLVQSMDKALRKNEEKNRRRENEEQSRQLVGIYDEDLAHRSYERKSRQLEKLKAEDPANALIKEQELEEKRKQKMKKRRARQYNKNLLGFGGDEVNAINVSNDQWNEKLERTYGKFTHEIKRNLEKGGRAS